MSLIQDCIDLEQRNESIKFDELPNEILINIFEKLPNKELGILAQVNKKLNQIANDQFLWKKKLNNDIHKWKVIDSKTYPKELFSTDIESELNQEISYKQMYLNCCPILQTKKGILKKLETFQQVQNTLHLTSTSESLTDSSNYGCSNNLTLSSLSSFAMPMMVIGQIKEFIYRNVFNSNSSNENYSVLSRPETDFIPKLVMFGPGLETTTSCLVTNILWKSEFKTIGMIPGKDGYGSGIKLKLFNHKPFNLTILYTNVSKVRSQNNHNLKENRLLVSKKDEDSDETLYELQPQVREACLDASGFIYVIDNKHLASLNSNKNITNSSESIDPIENYKLELSVLMREVSKDLPLLILSCNTNDVNDEQFIPSKKNTGLSCPEIVEKLDLHKLNREWHLRNCEIFQPKMKDITFGFEWILDNLDEKYLIQKVKKVNNECS